jgi:hypothetical protein
MTTAKYAAEQTTEKIRKSDGQEQEYEEMTMKNKVNRADEKKPRRRRRGAMGLVVATAVAAAPVLGCDDAGPRAQADASADTLAMDAGSDADPMAADDAAADAIDADDASQDASPDGVRG